MITNPLPEALRPLFPRQKAPEMCGTRLSPDVQILLEKARNHGLGRTWSDILNRCARAFLTPLFHDEEVQAIQDKMGISELFGLGHAKPKRKAKTKPKPKPKAKPKAKPANQPEVLKEEAA